MNLGLAISYFSRTPFDAFDGSRWHKGAVQGNLESYERNVSSENIGVSRRMFKSRYPLDGKWQALRAASGARYLLANHNADVDRTTVYNHVYQLDEITDEIKVIAFETRRRASGAPGEATEVVKAQTYANFNHVTSFESSTLESIEYSQFMVEMPVAMDGVVNADCEIEENGRRYTVEEHSRAGLLLRVTATRRHNA